MAELVPIDSRFNRPISATGAIVPKDLNEAYRLAQVIHMAGLQPKDLNTPEKIMVAIMHGMEIGLKPMQAMQRIAVINNRPTIWGDAAIGLVYSSGLCEFVKEAIEGQGDARTAVCEAKRIKSTVVTRATFSVSQAKEAGLWGKDIWKKYPDRMLAMRARGFALRDAFADVLGGMYLREEIEGEAIGVTPALPTPPAPPPAPPKLPIDALADWPAFRQALDSAPTMDALNAMFETLTKTMQRPEDLDQADAILREIAEKFPVEEGAASE